LLQELVTHPEVDLMLVLTQAPQHKAGIRAAIAAGKNVYCDRRCPPAWRCRRN
jgi:predicted dehydrogenase